ncbi:MAG: hypothetical protein COV30_00605 [Candidatus Yanofskybacteria bacterium CG10_big_fil_rev_8_21_14_0_10_37_15]|uniref:Endonuclease NucS C-terminal domain-containing protein n=1 Tax=Candidatus Yanofskybacteria bacterium CG10_big_fil_rev_8_21_14_0_10_37_15 TaxID=1975097 RepID=A0A2H0R673_9BACT|nr:MAG: hypothetical protein COV30_00605 [Candidatus Yanofskybacteria bacterium CG10_big_fil_rev_8_21_14_0_10_37_15]
MAIIDGLGLGDTSKYKSFGEQIIYSNRDIINGFKEKFNIEAFPRMISHFAYRPFLRAIWEASFSEKPEEIDEVSHEVSSEQDFYIEKHLEDFLIANWEKTPLSIKYELIEEDGELKSQQYKTEIGYIDLLVKDRSNNTYVVIELKKGQTSDDTIGQLSRYMGWVKKNLAQDKEVKGIVIAGSSDIKLKYALS